MESQLVLGLAGGVGQQLLLLSGQPALNFVIQAALLLFQSRPGFAQFLFAGGQGGFILAPLLIKVAGQLFANTMGHGLGERNLRAAFGTGDGDVVHN